MQVEKLFLVHRLDQVDRGPAHVLRRPETGEVGLFGNARRCLEHKSLEARVGDGKPIRPELVQQQPERRVQVLDPTGIVGFKLGNLLLRFHGLRILEQVGE